MEDEELFFFGRPRPRFFRSAGVGTVEEEEVFFLGPRFFLSAEELGVKEVCRGTSLSSAASSISFN